MRYRFFEGLLEHAKTRTSLHANISPSKRSWVGVGSGIAGVAFNYVVRQHDARVELYIDTRDSDKNQRISGALADNKDSIERTFGHSLKWGALKGRQACRISKAYGNRGYLDEDKWEAVYEALVDAMAKFGSALKPHLKGL